MHTNPILKPCAALAAALLVSLTSARTADWPQYRGPHLDGTTTEKLLAAWPEGGPRQVWKVPTPTGFSSFTVAGGRAFTLVRRNVGGADREVCVAFDAASGKELWASEPFAVCKYDGGADAGGGGDGPRSTPSVDSDSVYVLDSRLTLACLHVKTGLTVWKKDLFKDHAGRNLSWQGAASPMVDGNLIYVAGGGPGQSLLGVHKKTGNVVWKAHDEKMTHATPVPATIHGVRQIIFFTQSGLVSVAPLTGALLWRHSFPYRTSTAASPIVSGDIVYCSAGYGVGGGAVRVSKEGAGFKAAELWRKPGQVVNHWSTPVVKDGHLYGMFSFKEYGSGPLACVELATGEQKWSQSGFGPGNVILAGGHLLVLGDKGQLVLVDPKPSAYTELARATVVEGKCWSTPVVSGGRVYVRSTREGVCLDLAPRTTAR
jgi:hypothetical protein